MRVLRMIILFTLFPPAILAAAVKPVITVLDFSMDGISESEMRALVSRLSAALFNTGKFTVIDVTQRDTLLRELEFSASGCTDEACQLKIGRMLSAEMIVVGNIGKVGSRYHFSAKMLETETARTRSAVDGLYQSIDVMVDDLSHLAIKLEETALSTSPPVRAKDIWGFVSLLAGAGSGGLGGYFLFDVGMNGKAAIDQARMEYDQASAADAEARWAAFSSTVEGTKNRLYWGIGLSAAGALFVGIGVITFLIPDAPLLAVNVGSSSGTLSLALAIRY